MVANGLVRGDRHNTVATRGYLDRALVLVVTSSPLLRHSLASRLTEEGYWSILATTSDDALAEIARNRMDALVVDARDPTRSAALVTIRQRTDLPLIALVAPGDSGAGDAVIAAFDAGADQCVVWSDSAASNAEFPALTRVLASLLRRAKDDRADGGQILVGPMALELRPRAHEASVSGKDLELTPKEFAILQLLLERRRDVLSADAISEALWGHETFGARNFVEAHVSRLRQKLRDAGARGVITTVRGVGYTIR